MKFNFYYDKKEVRNVRKQLIIPDKMLDELAECSIGYYDEIDDILDTLCEDLEEKKSIAASIEEKNELYEPIEKEIRLRVYKLLKKEFGEEEKTRGKKK